MTPQEQLNKLIEGIGVISELTYIYYSGLVKAGFREDQALHLAESFVNNMMRDVINEVNRKKGT